MHRTIQICRGSFSCYNGHVRKSITLKTIFQKQTVILTHSLDKARMLERLTLEAVLICAKAWKSLMAGAI